MKMMVTVLAFLFLMLTACGGSGSGHEHKTMVGGPCTYKSFTGTCRLTDASADGKFNFDFRGTVDAKEVFLKNNKTMLKIAPGVDMPCELKFITSGTCTPCLLSMGECGEEAWETFRGHKGN